jgi:outer membrane protein OmpA-like peptidoglycan-associated protein
MKSSQSYPSIRYETNEQKHRNDWLRTAGWMSMRTVLMFSLAMPFLSGSAAAQDQAAQSDQSDQQVPLSAVVTKSVQAVGYQVGGGSTKVDMKGTELMPEASGQAKVQIKSKAGRTSVEVEAKRLRPPSTFGAEFLTYVLWVVTPEGRTGNTGEILLNKNGDGTLSATTPGQTFSLIVTAEPYFAVRVPSEMVVLQSKTRKDTKGKIFPVSEYKLMKRGQYEKMGNPLALTLDPNVPLEMYEARNAVEIAKSHGADKYAPEIFSKAEGSLTIAENSLARKADKNAVMSTARQTAQFSEDARALAVQRQEEERIAKEREDAAAKAKSEAEAKAAVEAAEAKRKADADLIAAKQKADAEIAAKEAQKQAAEAQRLAAEREKQELRKRLLEQFNRVLPTTDTPRGLVVNMGDVLFDTGKSDLRSEAREALAKLSGIVLNYPSLRLTIEGHTDSTGGAEFNQTLSEKRADAVRDYLVSQGLGAGSLSAQGLGMDEPVADNSTAEGRQRNRRVEIIVSGEVIGTQIGTGT